MQRKCRVGGKHADGQDSLLWNGPPRDRESTVVVIARQFGNDGIHEGKHVSEGGGQRPRGSQDTWRPYPAGYGLAAVWNPISRRPITVDAAAQSRNPNGAANIRPDPDKRTAHAYKSTLTTTGTSSSQRELVGIQGPAENMVFRIRCLRTGLASVYVLYIGAAAGYVP